MKMFSRFKCISFYLVLSMFFQFSFANLVFAETSTETLTLSDIKGHWAEKQITNWTSRGLIKGYGDGTFRPDNSITRAEFMTLVNSAYGFKDQIEIAFTDVNTTHWFYNQVAVAIRAGYIKGYSDHTMRPNQKISREEVAVIVSRLIGLEQTNPTGNTVFSDAHEASVWAIESIEGIVLKGIMQGYKDQTFRPGTLITRAEAIVTLDNASAVGIGTPVDSTNTEEIHSYDVAGTYGPLEGIQTIEGDVSIGTGGIILRNTVIEGDLTFKAGIGAGDISLEHVTVRGATIINGNGDNSIYFRDTTLAEVIVTKATGSVRILAEGLTTILHLTAQSSVALEETALTAEGFTNVSLSKNLPAETNITLVGSFEQVNFYAKTVTVDLLLGSIKDLQVHEQATDVTLKLSKETSIATLKTEALLKVLGSGTIETVHLGERATESSFEREPKQIISAKPPTPIPVAPVVVVPPASPVIAPPITGLSVLAGTMEGSTRIIYNAGTGHTLRLLKSSTATIAPLVGAYAGNLGVVYTSGTSIPEAKVGEHIALFEVDSSQRVVKFVDLILDNAHIGMMPIVSAGGGHNIVLSSDGNVWSWGGNWWGQLGNGTETHEAKPAKVHGLSGTVKQVSAGTSYTIVVKHDGTVWNWGSTGSAYPVQVQGLPTAKYAAAGGNPVGKHSAVISETGELWMWGDNGIGQLGDGTLEDRLAPVKVSGVPAVKAVAVGYSHTVALCEDGSVWTWGSNYWGQLGVEDTENSSVPRKVAELSRITAVAAGSTFTIALQNDGTVWGWGNFSGVYSSADGGIPKLSPSRIEGLSDIIAVSARDSNIAVLKQDGTVWVWGDNQHGQIGNGGWEYQQVPQKVNGLDHIIAVSVGERHVIALRNDGKLYSWGDNNYGQLGNGETNAVSQLNPITGLDNIISINQGIFNSAALTEDGRIWVWGNGIIGNGTKYGTSTPVAITALPATTRVYSTGRAFLARQEDGSVWTWGNLYNKEILFPTQINGLTGIIEISANQDHTLFLQEDGSVWAIGNNWTGQLGNGTEGEEIYTPVKVVGLTGVKSIMSGYGHSAAVDKDGALWIWGDHILTPINVLTDVRSVAGGYSHAVAIKKDGTAWAWGQNWNGQLGIADIGYSNVPVQIQGISDVAVVHTSYAHTLALKSDGTVWAWGANEVGELGDTTITSKSVPVQVSGITNVVSISIGSANSFAVQSDGTMWGWGYNGDGRFGDGTQENKVAPSKLLMSNVKQILANGFLLILAGNGQVWSSGSNSHGQLGNGYQVFPRESLFDQLH